MGRLDTTSWYVKWCEPIVVALYERNAGAIRSSLADAYTALESKGPSSEKAACLAAQLTYLDFQAQLILKEENWATTHLPILLLRLSEPVTALSAERLRSRLYLQMRIQLDRLHIKVLTPPEFDEYFELLPEAEHVTEVWMYIANWAYKHRQTFYLEKAYEFALLQAKGFNETWTWQRVNLMLKLVRGDATRADVIWLIDQTEIPMHMRIIKKILFPRALELGLIDKNVEAKFCTRELELNSQAQQQLQSHLKPHLLNPQPAANN